MTGFPTIIVDSRETTPWIFKDFSSRVGKLLTGDYSLENFTDLICIERKSLQDIVGCIGKGRERFIRELVRMRGYQCRAVIIESTLDQIYSGKWYGQIKPSHILGSIASWRAKYQIEFIYGGNKNYAAEECLRLMMKYFDYCRCYASRFVI